MNEQSKTPMQEMIDLLDREIENNFTRDAPVMTQQNQQPYKRIKSKAIQLLEKEKQLLTPTPNTDAGKKNQYLSTDGKYDSSKNYWLKEWQAKQPAPVEERHQLEYSMYSMLVSWCPKCNQHFYNERNKYHTTKATSEHYHIVKKKETIPRPAPVPELKWVKVDSGVLPMEGQTVLIYFINSAGKHIAESTFEGFAFYYIAETPQGMFKEPFSLVTHWMPLPEPPSESPEQPKTEKEGE